jgi:hypothetical protein
MSLNIPALIAATAPAKVKVLSSNYLPTILNTDYK